MPLRAIFEGEARLLGVLGANATLGGARLAFTTGLHNLMPLLTDCLVVIQIGVALATFIYMLLKIRRILKQRKNQCED